MRMLMSFFLINRRASSQKAKPSDISLVEYLTEYLLRSGQLTNDDLLSFHPAICNRLDRNTSGLVTAGKTLPGLQELNGFSAAGISTRYYRSIALVSSQKTTGGRVAYQE